VRAGTGATAEAGPTPLSASARTQPASPDDDLDLLPEDDRDFDFPSDGVMDEESSEEDGERAAAPAAGQGPSLRPLTTFADVVGLAGDRRDAKLKVSLEEQVSLVKYDGVAGTIDIFLLPGASPDVANDLREKLNKWTGRRWIVALSKTPGEPPIGQMRREHEAQEIAALKRHPAVAAVLNAFPDAEVSPVRRIVRDRDDDSKAG
jgi:DNA polymerase-3 subunit gamma/tau